MCTTSEVKCREHAEAKHLKSDVYACFPHLKNEEPIDPQTLTNGQIGDRFTPASMDLQIFIGESTHDDGCLVFAYYKDGAVDPTFVYFSYALNEA
ncbi:hypothetical protein Goshw_002839 [Gossypium schwendimanii]|uniref:At2g23090-like zinc-binding domain-containing protein n=1 Tax=Gossypium schwendimanii TaxID=34291 RepID=A0A7J9MXQ7_GOSSC|nr:hypothetical protein [Gossypium schwendimanii]